MIIIKKILNIDKFLQTSVGIIPDKGWGHVWKGRGQAVCLARADNALSSKQAKHPNPESFALLDYNNKTGSRLNGLSHVLDQTLRG